MGDGGGLGGEGRGGGGGSGWIGWGVGDDRFGVGVLEGLFEGKDERVEWGVVFNWVELGGIKMGIVDVVGYGEKVEGIVVREGVLNKGGRVLDIGEDVGEGRRVLIWVNLMGRR